MWPLRGNTTYVASRMASAIARCCSGGLQASLSPTPTSTGQAIVASRGSASGSSAPMPRCLRAGGAGLGRLLLRQLLGGASCGLYAFATYLWPLWDPQRQSLDDKIVRTLVVRA